ncbi:hypothetical protein DBV15_03353 [Temnothorax longispinosus]|uniref:Uncharacterized protein n=1 Tax=Temnothorax longispinosus TaxID=300112 RepID=A0A4S2JTH6_9HYME|nr:hypothetical protein DBV15_03353 [Temnothorax longispinosus]
MRERKRTRERRERRERGKRGRGATVCSDALVGVIDIGIDTVLRGGLGHCLAKSSVGRTAKLGNENPQSARFATGFRFDRVICENFPRHDTAENGGGISGNLPECPAGNRKMNFMIDADDAHPAHSSFLNDSRRKKIAREKVSAYRETRRVQKTSSVIPDPINRESARSDAVPGRSPGVKIRVGRPGDGNWLLKFHDNRGKFYSLFVLATTALVANERREIADGSLSSAGYEGRQNRRVVRGRHFNARTVACGSRKSLFLPVVSSLGGRKSVQSTKLAITAISRIVCPEMQLREENHCLRFNTAERVENGERELARIHEGTDRRDCEQ